MAAVTFALALPAFVGPPVAARTDDGPMDVHVLLPGRHGEDVSVAVEGALQRLSQPACRSVLSDFVDEAGRPLETRLQAAGVGARAYLASLRFVDGWDYARCREDSITVAFTQPGSHVVYVCGPRFSEAYPRNSVRADVVILHEFLHSLGLGESPPSPEAISAAVEARCGG